MFSFNLEWIAKYKWIGVIISKKMRRLYPNTFDNVITFFVFFGCLILFLWRLKGYQVFYQQFKPIGKPLITKEIMKKENLSIEDLCYAYENNSKYELEPSLIKMVEEYKKNKNI